MRSLNALYEWLLTICIAVLSIIGVHVLIVILFRPDNAQYLFNLSPPPRQINGILPTLSDSITITGVDSTLVDSSRKEQ
jgi:hypothetical protein